MYKPPAVYTLGLIAIAAAIVLSADSDGADRASSEPQAESHATSGRRNSTAPKERRSGTAVQGSKSKPAAEEGKILLASSLVFHASFDATWDARVTGGDGRLFTADTLDRKQLRAGNHRRDVSIARGKGKYGDALRFGGASPQVLLYKVGASMYRRKRWSGTVSFWLRLDPDKDLPAGFSDPLLMTERKWNDAAFFIDFDKDLPRDLRLGVFSDYRRWNPEDTPLEKIPVDRRPMLTVKKPPFSTSAWTHVLFTFENVNPADGSNATATLYLDGQSKGTLRRPLYFDWDTSKAAVMLGIHYVGDFDDLAIFNKALSTAEINHLRQLPRGAGDVKIENK